MDRAIRYSVRFVTDRAAWTPSEWRCKARGQVPGYGAPNEVNLAKHCAVVEASTLPDGVNSHLGATKILRAEIYDHLNSKTVALFRA